MFPAISFFVNDTIRTFIYRVWILYLTSKIIQRDYEKTSPLRHYAATTYST